MLQISLLILLGTGTAASSIAADPCDDSVKMYCHVSLQHFSVTPYMCFNKDNESDASIPIKNTHSLIKNGKLTKGTIFVGYPDGSLNSTCLRCDHEKGYSELSYQQQAYCGCTKDSESFTPSKALRQQFPSLVGVKLMKWACNHGIPEPFAVECRTDPTFGLRQYTGLCLEGNNPLTWLWLIIFVVGAVGLSLLFSMFEWAVLQEKTQAQKEAEKQAKKNQKEAEEQKQKEQEKKRAKKSKKRKNKKRDDSDDEDEKKSSKKKKKRQSRDDSDEGEKQSSKKKKKKRDEGNNEEMGEKKKKKKPKDAEEGSDDSESERKPKKKSSGKSGKKKSNKKH
ncbi:hypothetical protein BLNAU_490 [Blattamonas nauphoetae]|uniref:Transmembrane protein n=1 Tax=Blattamonas nauphoetae TaxID=2049346 RepID=A0ABQ9YLD8_9EUKA|nr:hypothetical protein BLNAU_490 [Blattamonas nauphoetae]